MNVLTSIILGLVQGLTEFIPVSSSGHMILAQKIFNITPNFKFDVLLNIGTLLALFIFYREAIVKLLKDVFIDKNIKLAISLIVATIPAVLIGFAFSDFIEQKLQSVWIVIVMLIVVGLAMVYARFKPKKKTAEDVSILGILKIGVVQAIALIPGTSRSGATMLAGQSEGLNAKEAARFSFLLAIPTITGATLKVAISSEGRQFISDNLGLIVLGNVVSFVAGSLAIRFLLDMLGKKGLKPFGWYRVFLGLLLIILIFAKII